MCVSVSVLTAVCVAVTNSRQQQGVVGQDEEVPVRVLMCSSGRGQSGSFALLGLLGVEWPTSWLFYCTMRQALH